jgi:hypothetical protein
MPNPTIRIHDTESNDVIDREMTDAEFAQFEADQQIESERLANLAAKEEARLSAVAKLEAIGLTADEIAALRG